MTPIDLTLSLFLGFYCATVAGGVTVTTLQFWINKRAAKRYQEREQARVEREIKERSSAR